MRDVIDSTDLKLIKLLQYDGRQSSQVLARKLGVHASTIQRRIDRMVKEGILKITAGIEPQRAGLNVGAAIGLKIKPGSVQQVTRPLVTAPNVAFLSTTTGRFDAMLFAAFRDEDDLSEFIENRIASLDGVRENEAFIFLNVAKGRRIQYAPGDGSLDSKLITLLQQDGRQSATRLSKELGISAAQVRRRIKSLIRNETIRIAAVVNITKIGVKLIAINGFQVMPGRSLEVQRALSQLPCTRIVVGTTGRFDVITWSRFNSLEELSLFLEHDLGKLKGIKGSETFMCLNIYKGGLSQL